MPSRIGHGPFPGLLGFTWPQQPFKWLVYDSRPDLLTSKTRATQWQKLNTHWRYVHALLFYLGPPSHILWNVRYAYLFVMAITAAACVWQSFHDSHGYVDIDEKGALKEAFVLTSFIMSLLLAFRLNKAYETWNMAQGGIAGVGSGATSLFLQAATWIKDNPRLVDDFRRFCILWPYAVKQTVTSAKKLDPVAEELLYPEERAIFYGSQKGRQVIVIKIRAMTYSANLPSQQSLEMEQSLVMTGRSVGEALCGPHAVGLMCAQLCTGIVMVWCCLLPFGMVTKSDGFDWSAFAAMSIITLLLLAVDEVTTQLEEPFNYIPLDDIVSTHERDINRVLAELKEMEEVTRAAHQQTDLQALAASKMTSDKCIHTV